MSEVVQAKRLGHRMAGVRAIWPLLIQPMIDALLAGLQSRWEQTQVADATTTENCSQATYPDQEPVKINCTRLAPLTQNGPSVVITDGPSDQSM